MFEKRISIFTGHFGSGKTEVAVNYALKLSTLYSNAAIVDFDIVNPFFRTSDAKKELEENNLWVITPVFANTNIDVPALPPEINSLFQKKEYKVVFDVGGDDLGARALSRYRDEISKDDFEVFAVINTKRPMTDSVEKIEEMIFEIEKSSRLKISKLVNNTNLLNSTSMGDVIKGQELIERVSEKLKIGIGFTSIMSGNTEHLDSLINTEILSMRKLIKLPWD